MVPLEEAVEWILQASVALAEMAEEVLLVLFDDRGLENGFPDAGRSSLSLESFSKIWEAGAFELFGLPCKKMSHRLHWTLGRQLTSGLYFMMYSKGQN